jgi:ribonuclease R
LTVHRILRAVLALGWELQSASSEESGARRARRSASRAARRQAQRDEQPFAPIVQVELAEIGEESSEAERRAQEAERELMEWKKARFLADRLGEEFDALIISVTKFGFFVELLDLFIEGLVPIDTLTDQPYVHQEQARQWMGQRTKRRFRIGDRVRVRLDRVGELGGKMNFSVAE